MCVCVRVSESVTENRREREESEKYLGVRKVV